MHGRTGLERPAYRTAAASGRSARASSRLPGPDPPRGRDLPLGGEEGAPRGAAGAAAARAGLSAPSRLTTRSCSRTRTSGCGCSTASAPTRRTSSASRGSSSSSSSRSFPAGSRERRPGRCAEARPRLERRLLDGRGAVLAGHGCCCALPARRRLGDRDPGHRPLDARARAGAGGGLARSRRRGRSRRRTSSASCCAASARKRAKMKAGPEIRAVVRFSALNLNDDELPGRAGRFDLILCRNVLIYFDAAVEDARHPASARSPGAGRVPLPRPRREPARAHRPRAQRRPDGLRPRRGMTSRTVRRGPARSEPSRRSVGDAMPRASARPRATLFHVLVVDDSAVVRQVMTAVLGAGPGA